MVGTLLFYAFSIGNDEFIPFLIKLGINVNNQDTYGETILHYGIRAAYSIDIIKKMIDIGVDPSLKNKAGIDVPTLVSSYTDMDDIPEIGKLFGLDLEYQPLESEQED